MDTTPEIEAARLSRPPDWAEQDKAAELDDLIPAFGYNTLPIVGLGGSAGSVNALQELFRSMPADTGLAFVVVIHLSDEHESILDQILTRCTSMPVIQVQDPVKVAPNHVYVIAPGKQISVLDGRIAVEELQHPRGRRVAVDLFFRTLADTHGPHSTGIILTGTDSDGAIGIKRIKERGGLTICQDPGEAEFEGMPQAAITTGMVDWVLPLCEIPDRLVQYQRNAEQLRLDRDVARPGGGDPAALEEVPEAGKALREILSVVNLRTGRDFSKYKKTSILRRIARRMNINGEDSLEGYLAFLRTHPSEVGSLLQDLLISVTNFFRDKDAFSALERELSPLFKNKGSQDHIRVWVPGCATGEEAYSLAILLDEYASRLDDPPKIQIFATDLDENAIKVGREGAYPEAIAADVSEERLRKYFSKERSFYRVHRDLRETVLFAVHDILKDSPFSRLDLISCRNLLIYLNRQAQEHCMKIFHFALQPEKLLLLGVSESADEDSVLFTCKSKVHRLFQRRPSRTGTVSLPVPEVRHSTQPASKSLFPDLDVKYAPRHSSRSDSGPQAAGDISAHHLEGLHYQLLEHLAPPSLLVDLEHRIIPISEHAGRYLRVPGGGPERNLLQLIHPDLRIELLSALLQAAESGQSVEAHGIPLEIDGTRISMALRVRAVLPELPEYLMVVFEESEATSSAALEPRTAEEMALVTRLEAEIQRLKAQLRKTVDQYETSTEEMRASNEELQAVNEEMRSATEELETGREELQSINEELTTVNHELNINIEELGRSNSDLQNLISSTNIATIFLDRNLRIKRYTPNALSLFSLIPGDIGRPLSDLRHELHYEEMSRDAERILEDLVPREREIRSEEGRWYLARLSPYRTLEDQIAGVVFTFVDFTERRKAEDALRKSEERLRLALQAGRMGTWDWNLETGEVLWSAEHKRMYGIPEDQRLGSYDEFMQYVHEGDRERIADELRQALEEKRDFASEMRSPHPDGSERWISGNARANYNEEGRPVRMIGVVLDITESKMAADALRLSEERYRSLVNQSTVGILQTTLDGSFTYVNERFCELSGRTAEELLRGMRMRDILHPDDRKQDRVLLNRMIQTREGFIIEKRYIRPDGSIVWVMNNVTPLLDTQGNVVGRTASSVDITERKNAEVQLLQMATALDAELAAMTRLHELSSRLTAQSELMPMLEEVLDAAIEIQRAEYGMIQLLDPGTEKLEIVVQRGFPPEVLKRLAALDDSQVLCGRALRTGARQAVKDLHGLDELEAFRDIALGAGCQAVQCTPLIDRKGLTLGVLSTQFSQPRDFPEQDLRATDLYAQQAADMIRFRLNEEQLRGSEERLRCAISIETVGIIFFSKSGTVTETNDAFLEMSGYRKEDIEAGALNWESMTPPEWKEASNLASEELRSKGRTEPYEKEFLRKDGSRFWALISATQVSDDEGVEFIIDISGAKAAQMQLIKALEENEVVRADLEAADQAKDQFLAVLSHELRTPLTPVLMAVHLLKGHDGLPADAVKALDMIKRNVETECKLIDDLLDLTRIARGTMEIESEPVNLHDIINEAALVCKAELEQKKHQLALDLAAPDHRVLGDRTRLEQVFWNLLKNACKFTPKKGEVRVTTRNEVGSVLVEISDTGIGLDASALEKIFEAFTQGSEDVKKQHGGLGLGLAISKATVNAHGGTMLAASDGLGHGATFTVQMPLAAES